MPDFVVMNLVNPFQFLMMVDNGHESATAAWTVLSAASRYENEKAATAAALRSGLIGKPITFDEAQEQHRKMPKPSPHEDPFGLGAEWVTRQRTV
jgi:hypothetical protein